MITEQMALTFHCYHVVPNLSGLMKNEQYSANNSLTPATVLLFVSGIM